MAIIISKNIFLSHPNLAPLRLGGINFRIQVFSLLANLRTAQIFSYSNTTSTQLGVLVIRNLRVLRDLRGEIEILTAR